MNDTIIVGLIGGIGLLASTAYWRRRERIVRESLTTSRAFDTERQQPDSSRTQQAAREAARSLNCTVAALPDRVEAIDDERRSLRNTVDAVRAAWADEWWDTFGSAEIGAVIQTTLSNGTHEDVTAFAKRAMDEPVVAVVVGGADGSFAVTVGQELSEEFGADTIAEEITAAAGGGAGGTDRLATGGTGTSGSEDLVDACRTVAEKLDTTAVQASANGVQ